MKGWSSFALALAMSAAFGQKGTGAPRDVPKDHWAFSAVDEMFKLGLLDGYPDGSINGSKSLSRNEMVDAPKSDHARSNRLVELANLSDQLADLPFRDIETTRSLKMSPTILPRQQPIRPTTSLPKPLRYGRARADR